MFVTSGNRQKKKKNPPLREGGRQSSHPAHNPQLLSAFPVGSCRMCTCHYATNIVCFQNYQEKQIGGSENISSTFSEKRVERGKSLKSIYRCRC